MSIELSLNGNRYSSFCMKYLDIHLIPHPTMRLVHEFNFYFRRHLPFSIRGIESKNLRFYYLKFTELNKWCFFKVSL